jgi:hypothetical protein
MDLSPRRRELARSATAGFVEGDPEKIQERRCELARKPPPPPLPSHCVSFRKLDGPLKRLMRHVTLARSRLSRLRLSARFLTERHFISSASRNFAYRKYIVIAASDAGALLVFAPFEPSRRRARR